MKINNLPYDPIQEIRKYLNSEEWSNPNFSVEKSFVMSVFSEMSYWQIPQFELENSKRVKVVPCETYEILHKAKIGRQIVNVLGNQDFGQFEFINRRYASTTVFRNQDLIVIAIRGTKDLYDWYINSKFRRIKLTGKDDVKFHRGFFRAIRSSFDEIHQKIYEAKSKFDVPIYVTGHSLGGAMSSILFATWTDRYHYNFKWRNYPSHRNRKFNDSELVACYTFGMPRYCNEAGIMQLRTPYHLYNRKDIVPALPPRIFGYSSGDNEFRLDGKRIENFASFENLKQLKWSTSLMIGKRMKEHSMELYRSRIKELI